ncbi:hypothetical protein WH7805_11368 [Synechococcus sp. WH 7805]|nr:hypothetical protein WH7805_11368 [Synechococcus sp. WH 7805]
MLSSGADGRPCLQTRPIPFDFDARKLRRDLSSGDPISDLMVLHSVTAMGVVIYLGLVGAGLVTAAAISLVLRGIKLI